METKGEKWNPYNQEKEFRRNSSISFRHGTWPEYFLKERQGIKELCPAGQSQAQDDISGETI
jgi:hypothetical protein